LYVVDSNEKKKIKKQKTPHISRKTNHLRYVHFPKRLIVRPASPLLILKGKKGLTLGGVWAYNGYQQSNHELTSEMPGGIGGDWGGIGAGFKGDSASRFRPPQKRPCKQAVERYACFARVNHPS
jgi:hypothetical protein